MIQRNQCNTATQTALDLSKWRTTAAPGPRCSVALVAPDLIQSEQEKIVVDLRRLGAPKPLSDIGDPRSELARLRNKESSAVRRKLGGEEFHEGMAPTKTNAPTKPPHQGMEFIQ